ncbi:VOC family protein [Chitinophaga sp. LS1]|uniref:VOC family protein n=1 Tax=Chitinophaga sp. LS1 TaxID=3051176 RepID=UPI002AAAF226|nr:VOC family protein [Chitinophaga sp. LS1]WPV65265.1 VOC family protein [Chitinophaga sp. LS1]
MNNSIYPCLTIKGKIAEAADFYLDTFGDGAITSSNPIVITLKLSGQQFMLLNDRPSSTPNPSISFMVLSENEQDTEAYYLKLINGGSALMPLDTYPWSSKYAWVQDKFGISWQLYTGGKNDMNQKFCPTLMFTGPKAGKAEEAVHFYSSLFPENGIQGILKYSEGEDNTNYVKHAQFKIKNFVTMAMDSSAEHGFGFVDAISLVVNCKDQAEIDKYWDGLIANGGHEVACGWLVDKYGISWQIVPDKLGEWMTNPGKFQHVMGALMKMKKLIYTELENA